MHCSIMPEDGVLVLDADERSALAATRSLGRAGIRVCVADAGRTALAARSRFCRTYCQTADPRESVSAFRASVVSAASKTGVHLVLPMTDASTTALLDRDIGLRLMAPPRDAYQSVSDKYRLLRLAETLEIPTPRTIRLTASADASAVGELGFPLVLKPQRSRILANDRIIPTAVNVARSLEDLTRYLRTEDCPVLAQEFIPGSGAGISTLFGRSGPIAWFAHRRLREKPPAGGVSVLSQSVAIDPQLQRWSEQLLHAVEWSGPAMVEWRITSEGRPYLMEINGRYWGSLELAIDCGVDFPRLHYAAESGELVQSGEYEVGRRLRWLLGDLDRLLLQLRGRGTARAWSEKGRDLLRFARFFGPRERLEVLRLSDPMPFLHEAQAWLRQTMRLRQ